MPDSGSDTKSGRSVGDRVQVRRPGGELLAGTIIEDYVDSVVPVAQLGRGWAVASRWAIALDSGVLVFVDDQALFDDEAIQGVIAGPEASLAAGAGADADPGGTEDTDAEQGEPS